MKTNHDGTITLNAYDTWTSCVACGQRVTGDSIHTCSPQLKTLTDDPLVNFKPVWQEKPELTLTDEEIIAEAEKQDWLGLKSDSEWQPEIDFARAILRKAQEK
jgi:hypothetical protein